MEQQFELIAKTFQGLEEVLAAELTELGADNISIGRRMVSFTGNQEMMYRANFCLRTAIRILKPIKHFTARDADEVYAAVQEINWSDYLDLDNTFSVDSVIYSQEFRHSKFVAYKVKDAIVDYFREATGKRPNIGITNPDMRLNIHVADTDCTLSLVSSGDSVPQRGYRTGTVDAPINEVLAAGLIKLSGWQYDCDFIDPFCGSGTLLIEAALMARNIYPGVFRRAFGFEKWKDFNRELLDRIYNDDSQERPFNHRIYGYDINNPALEVAARNVKSAGVADCITLAQQDFRKFTQPQERAIMITNPPYGERLNPADLLGLYRAIGERLKHQFVGSEAWIICSREELFEAIGLKPSFRIPLLNGSLDCELRKYQIFDGKMDDYRSRGGIVKTDEERRRMAEKRRFKADRDFKKRRADDDTDDDADELIPAYMRRLHRDFERNHVARSRRDGADEGGGAPYHARQRRHTSGGAGADRRSSGGRRGGTGGRASSYKDDSRRRERR